MIKKTPVRRLTIATLAGLCVACSSGNSGSPIPATDQTPLATDGNPLTGPDTGLSNDPLNNDVNDRLLDRSASTTSVLEIDTCFCLEPYTDTTKIYNFSDQQAVLVVTFDNQTINFTTSATLHFFARTETPERVSRWINNLYSDALFSNAARPVAEYPIGEETISIISATLIDPVKVEAKVEGYDSYQLEYMIDNQTEGSEYTLVGFSDTATVHVPNSP